MLGILLLYFIGKSFYRLAEIYNKSKWTFAIVGIATYYAGTVVGALLIGPLIVYYASYSYITDMVYGLIGIPFGLLAWWGLYTYLKNDWSKSRKPKNHDILDEGLFDD